MEMAPRTKSKVVCVYFANEQGKITLFYVVTMEFIIFLMMLQLRRVSVGCHLRGMLSSFSIYTSPCLLEFCSLPGSHLTSNQCLMWREWRVGGVDSKDRLFLFQ